MPEHPRLSSLPASRIVQSLCGEGLRLRTGPFVFNLRSPHRQVHEGVQRLYADQPLAAAGEWVDFDLLIDHGTGVRRWFRPQARFLLDGTPLFEPLPAAHAYALLEWSMNACISLRVHHHLVLHAAVIEREGFAAVLPAPSGSGKSTLCAGLIHAGWRLLSDELALVSLDGPLRLTPLCRPVSLKNAAIDVIRDWAPQAVFSRVVEGTTKGRVAHVKAPADHLARVHEAAVPRWVVFPRWQAGVPAVMTPRPRAQSMLELGRSAFNYAALGSVGFDRLADMVEMSDCMDFHYSRLEDAVQAFDALVQQARAQAGSA